MKIFITGIAGFLGSHLADSLIRAGHTVSGNDNLIGGYVDNIPRSANFHYIDCNSRDKLTAAMAGTEVVVHCAATAYEGLSVFSPSFVTTNIVGASVATFSAAISNKVRRIVHCSSMARYGAIPTPFREGDECKPQDPYGIGKYCCEGMLRNLAETHEFEYVVAVPHNIIGPRQKYDDPYRNVASIMINRVLSGQKIIIYGDGSQQRCFSYIDDCLSCLMKLIYGNYHGEVFNIGPDENPVTINELAQLVSDIAGDHHPEFQYMPGRPQEVKIALCSSDKARIMLNYQTQTTLAQGLEKMFDYIHKRGTKPFDYHLPIEIVSGATPETWTKKLF